MRDLVLAGCAIWSRRDARCGPGGMRNVGPAGCAMWAAVPRPFRPVPEGRPFSGI